ncbi:TetR/AcrR family transcriptional regulator [Actinokineospora sp. HUAS TT18]|uniref:TetR/AcrR family transcriptional regulator n=1 Tax=Actinokineospora sp. HUAS TT18 TaxID=3447451 RepID=UPI003F5269C1
MTEAARRTQIVEAAIEVIAEVGYAKASYARIVEHAGLSSTRLISYHFRDKDDLMMAVLVTALGAADEVLESRIADQTDRVALLGIYIQTRVDLLRTHPQQLRAIAEVAEHRRDFAPVLHDFRVGRLERQLRQGQRAGTFGEFDPAVMATAISSAIEGADRSGVDPSDYGTGLTRLFVRACT